MGNANTWTELQTFTNASTTGTLTINQICNGLGECWDTPGFEGSQVNFYPNNDTSEIGIYEDMLTYPKGAVAIDESCGADSDIAGGYCTIDTYISTTTDIAILNYPAGLTRIRAYTYVDSPSGISKLEFNGYKRDSAGVESYIGQATTTEINSASVAEFIANFIGLTDFPFNSDGTDRLVMVVKGWTDSNQAKTIHWTYQNNNYYSHFESPITIADEGLARTYADETITGNWTHTGKLTMGNASTTQIGSTGSAYFATSNGNVGIGTTTPWGKLAVNANFGETNKILFNVASSTATATTSLFVIDRNGNVGIGTTNPTNRLQIIQANDAWGGGIRLQESGGSGYGAGFYRGAGSTGAFIINNNGLDTVAIASGNVGIGTTTPQWLLNPYSATASQLSLSAGAGISQWAFRNAGGNLYFATTTIDGTATTTTSALTIIGSTGNVGIGTTTPAWKLTVGTGLYVDGKGTIGDLTATSTLTAPAGFGGRSMTVNGTALDADAELYTEPLASFNIGSSTMSTTTGTFMGKKIPIASTITGVACDTDVGTSTIQCDIRNSGTPNTAGTNISNGGFQCGSGAGQTASTTIASTAITALQTINCNIPDASPVGGTKPSIIHIYIYGTKND
jgi:hypothetical protein